MQKTGFTHESTRAITHDWISPKYLIDSLGPFDLDPCTSLNQLWATAKHGYTIKDDGLKQKWFGRVWLNPPYGKHAQVWLTRLAKHGNGIAFIFARTETRSFFNAVWLYADSLLFLKGRVQCYRPNGVRGKGAGAPSVLVAYGENNTKALSKSGLAGALVLTAKVIGED